MNKTTMLFLLATLCFSFLVLFGGTSSSPNLMVIKKDSNVLDFNKLYNFPGACPAGQAVKAIDHNVFTCVAVGGGSGGNPFDQNLNTTDSPTFENLNIRHDINVHGDDDIFNSPDFNIIIFGKDTNPYYDGCPLAAVWNNCDNSTCDASLQTTCGTLIGLRTGNQFQNGNAVCDASNNCGYVANPLTADLNANGNDIIGAKDINATNINKGNFPVAVMVTGTYDGNSATEGETQTINIGFRPDYLKIIPNGYGTFGTACAAEKTDTMPATYSWGYSFGYPGDMYGIDMITSFTANGFTVKNGNADEPTVWCWLNDSAVTYHYIAWRN